MGWDSREPANASALAFLEALFPGEDLPGELVLWGAPSRASRWHSPAGLEDVARAAETWGKTENVYFGLALQDRARAFEAKRREGGNPTPENTRGRNESAVAIGGLWAEIDTTDGDHKATNLPTMEEAFDLLEGLPVAPSILVLSGGGVHVYWLFRELLTIETEEMRGEVSRLVHGWQAFLRERMKAKGWKLDETHELARVFRVPGTLNHKYTPPRPVTVDLFEPDRRYNPGDFEPYIPEGIEAPVIPQGEDDGRRLDDAEALRLSAHLLERARTRIEAGEARHVTTRWAFLQANDNRIPKGIAASLVEPLERAATRKGGGRPIDPGEFARVLSWAYGKPRRAPWATVEGKLEADGPEAPPRDAPAEWAAGLEEWRGTFDRHGISTGVPNVDNVLGGGWRERRLYVVAGLTGTGKTAFALRVAHAAAEAGVPVLFASYEVEDVEIRARLVAPLVGMFYGKALAPDLLEAKDRNRLASAWEDYARGAGARIFVSVPLPEPDATPRPGSIAWVKAHAERIGRAYSRPPLVVVDYLQPAATFSEGFNGDAGNLRLAVGATSLGLRDLARSVSSPVLVLSSIPRSAYLKRREGYRLPELGDLKESGEIEFNADSVAYLWPERDDWEAHEGDDEERDPLASRPILFRVVKGRQGGTGTALLAWNPPMGTFADGGKPERKPREKRSRGKDEAKTFDADALASLVADDGKLNGGTAEIELERAFTIAAAEFNVTRKKFNGIVAKYGDRFLEKKRGGIPFLVLAPGEGER